jgi:flagellar basal-body rod modification protein FlgD
MGIISPIGVDGNGNPLGTGSPQILGKEDFLRLLVAKLTHQDPLNPVTDEAFVADLAQFSSLEQLQNLNEALGSSLQWDLLQMQTINNTMATSLIGKEVKASYSSIYLSEDNNPGIGFSTTEYAESIKVTIMNSDGAVVRTIVREDIPPGDNSITWDGKDDNGKRLGEGFYQIEISGVNGEGESFSPSAYVRALVTGVVYHDGSAYLQVNGMEIPLGNVAAIYAADTEGEG